MESPENKPQRNNKGAMLALGIAIGAAFGAALDALPIGIAMGIAIGLALGAVADSKSKQDKTE